MTIIEKMLERALKPFECDYILRGMNGLKERAKTLVELADSALIYVRPFEMDEKAQAMLTPENIDLLKILLEKLKLCDFNQDALEALLRKFAESAKTKLGQLAAPLRVAVTGKMVSPSLFEVMAILGKEESLKRIAAVV
jgi:glutamyl-tRNA synthetase